MATQPYTYKKYLSLLFWSVVITTLLLWLTPRMVHYIDSNKAGVRWERFGEGTVHSELYEAGFHLIAPWDKLETYLVSPQQATLQTTAITATGKTARLTVAVDYQLIKDHLSFLHQQVGPDYQQRWLLADIESRVRKHTGSLDTEQLCTEPAQRQFAKNLLNQINQATQQRSITDFVQIRNIQLLNVELICQ